MEALDAAETSPSLALWRGREEGFYGEVGWEVECSGAFYRVKILIERERRVWRGYVLRYVYEGWMYYGIYYGIYLLRM